MADMTFDYPVVLTKKAWDKNKGVIAKIAIGKTDVGASLAAIEEAFSKAGFFDVAFFGSLDPLEYLEYEKDTVAKLSGAVSGIKAKIKDAVKNTDAAEEAFHKSKTVPKSATQYVKSICGALGTLAGDAEEFIKQVEKDLRKNYREKLHKTQAYNALWDASKAVDAAYKNLMGMIKNVESNPTLDALHSEFASDGPHRKLTTYCKLWDQLVPPSFPRLAAKIYSGKAMNDYAKLPGMMAVANETNGDASKKLRELVEKKGIAEDRVVTTFLLQYSKSVMEFGNLFKAIKEAAKVLLAI